VAPVANEASRLGAVVLREWESARVRRLLVRAGSETVRALAELPAVEWIEDAPRPTLRNDVVRWVIQSNIENETPLYDRGLFGEGQILGHIDDRIAHLVCFFLDPVVPMPGPTHRKLVSYHSTAGFGASAHGTHTAGTLAGDQEPVNGSILHRGMAPRARIAFASLFDVISPDSTLSNLDSLLGLNHADGARIHSNSWGDDRFETYTALCRDADAFSRENEEDLVVFAATNFAELKTPENAKNVLAVGASRRPPNEEHWQSGGIGPTNDGRRKPEVYAPGENTQSANAFECTFSASTGTSMACPAVAGGAALVREYFMRGFYPVGSEAEARAFTPTGALLKAMLIQSGEDMFEPGYPGDREGWGRILLDDALYFRGDADRLWVQDTRHADGLETAQTHTYSVRVEDGSQRLRVTLAFTDEPASLGANPAAVNDLNLEVEGGGDLYLGNVFDVSAGVSETGGSADPLNNVERAIIASPAEGEWTIRVRGASIPLGPQGYALVVNGGLFHLSRFDAPAQDASGSQPQPRDLPAEVALSSPRPNPFSNETRYEAALPNDAKVRVAIYDVSGRLMRVLVDRTLPAGRHSLSWDGRNEQGEAVPSGIYFARLSTPGFERQVKGVLLR